MPTPEAFSPLTTVKWMSSRSWISLRRRDRISCPPLAHHVSHRQYVKQHVRLLPGAQLRRPAARLLPPSGALFFLLYGMLPQSANICLAAAPFPASPSERRLCTKRPPPDFSAGGGAVSYLELPSQMDSAASRASPVARTAFPGALAASPTTRTWGTKAAIRSLSSSRLRVPMASTTLSYPRREPSVPSAKT